MDGRNLFDPEVAADPYPYYRWLRDREGLHFSEPLGAWLVSRHADVAAAFRAHDVLSSAPPGGSPAGARFLLNSDPPDHTELRRVVGRFFTPAATRTLAERVRAVATLLVADLLAAGPGRADVMHQVANPLPVIVIAELLGIPPERRDDFKRWSDATIGGVEMNPRRLAQATLEMDAYFGAVIEERAAAPAEDLISRLVRDGTGMTRRELRMFCALLLIAGNETTTNLIGNLVLALLDNPDQARLLRADRSLLPAAVEEAMRYDAPVQGVWRLTTARHRFADTDLPAGARLLLLQGAANRDGDRFPDPDRFDVTRDAREHVGFGVGIHFCLGTHLARLEAQTVVDLLLDHLDTMRPAGAIGRILPEATARRSRGGRPRVRRHPVVRGLHALPVTIDRSAVAVGARNGK